MRLALKSALAVLAALCVLLLAGAFPLMGAEDVYRGGAMILAGTAAMLLSLLGGYQLAAGARARLVGGLICLFFTGAGVAILWQFSAMGIRLAQTGGPLWAGAVAMFSTALLGGVFTGIFGYLCHKCFHTQRLWLAAAHICLALLVAGAFTDYFCEKRTLVSLPVDGKTALSSVSIDGTDIPLDFSLTLTRFDVSYYDTHTYALYTMKDGKPAAPQELMQEGDMLRLGAETWPLSSLKTAPGMPHPFLMIPGEEPRVILQNPPTVRDYAAACTLHTTHRNRPEVRKETLRVNEPVECKGWRLYLTDYNESSQGTRVSLQVRRAPGRVPALAGIIGVVICMGAWCWKKN